MHLLKQKFKPHQSKKVRNAGEFELSPLVEIEIRHIRADKHAVEKMFTLC